jgi:hypothetical protein
MQKRTLGKMAWKCQAIGLGGMGMRPLSGIKEVIK